MEYLMRKGKNRSGTFYSKTPGLDGKKSAHGKDIIIYFIDIHSKTRESTMINKCFTAPSKGRKYANTDTE